MNQAARWISIVGHPFVMVALLVTVSALRLSSRTAAVQSLLLVVVSVLAPVAILMFREVRGRRWANIDASNPSERPVLFIVSLAGLAALLAWLMLNDSQSYLVRGVLVIGALILVAGGLARWIKLSLHIAFAAVAATSLSLLGSPVGYVLVGFVPLLAWSRLALSRHRPHELWLGLVVGVFAGIALVRL